MARKRFRWTRRRYEKARELARFMDRHLCELPDQMPDLLRRYFDLWARYPQRDDPLTLPQWRRPQYSGRNDDIPF